MSVSTRSVSTRSVSTRYGEDDSVGVEPLKRLEGGFDMSDAFSWERLWGASGLAFLALFGAGALAADWPAFDATFEEINQYFTENRSEVFALSFLHTMAALAFFLFGAYARGVLARAEGSNGNLSALAFGGAVMTMVFMMLSAMLFWIMTLPTTAADPAVARALLDLGYLVGSLGILIPLAIFVGSTSLAGLRTGILPRWLSWAGIVISVLSLPSPATMFFETGVWSLAGGGILLIPGFVGCFFWVFVATISLLIRGPGSAPVLAARPRNTVGECLGV